MKVALVLHNIRSTYNVGAILRTAEGLGIEQVVFSGYTPRFDDPKLLPHLRAKLNRQIAKSALGAENLVAQQSIEDLSEYLTWQRQAGWQVIGLENNLAASELPRRVILGQKADLGEQVVLVLGEEVEGIAPAIRAQMDRFLEVPMQGQKESFNVSVAAAIALWAIKNLY